MKKIPVFIALLLSASAGAQVRVAGDVFASDGSKAAFAEIELHNDSSQYRFACNGNGHFDRSVDRGHYTVSVRAEGHQLIVTALDLTNERTTVTYHLSPSETNLQGVRVSAVRAGERSPSTAITLDKKELIRLDQSKDIPFLLDLTPSTVINSDAGNGVGYTGIRIRGIDPTRVNVTINDVPLNDAESQGVYWVDLPDLSSSTQSIQVQRGVGTSTNGVAAFGASIHIQTDALPEERTLTQSLAVGSFGTRRLTVQYGTGTIGNGWNVLSRFSSIGSEGFIDRARSELLSGQLHVQKKWERTTLNANAMFGHERTYQAWWGIPQPKFEGDDEGVQSYISNLGMSARDSANLVDSDPWTYNYYTYENEVDDYGQHHAQVFLTHRLSDRQRLKATFHYTRGKGYFEQFKTAEELSWFEGQDLSSYGIEPYVVDGDTFYTADLVRRRWLDNHFYGAILNYHLQGDIWELTAGGSANRYLGRHFGEAIQTEFTAYEALNAVYYDEDATKDDINGYIKSGLSLGDFHPYVDLQYRGVDYSYLGYGEQGTERSPQRASFHFFNPKLGLSYIPSPVFKASAFYGVGNREPIRDDFINSRPDSRPRPERMQDLELNVQVRYSRSQVQLTLYSMDYRDALVLNGQLNDVGAYTRVNVDRAYRRGIELALAAQASRFIGFGGNLSLSDNRIAAYTEYVDDWYNGGQVEFDYTHTAMALSPQTVAAAYVDALFHSNLRMRLTSKYVGKQYLDNTENAERMLPAFHYLNAQFSYTFDQLEWFRQFGMDLYLNNITNARFAPSGYTFSGMLEDRADFNYVYPMAGFNWMFKIRMAF